MRLWQGVQREKANEMETSMMAERNRRLTEEDQHNEQIEATQQQPRGRDGLDCHHRPATNNVDAWVRAFGWSCAATPRTATA